MGLLLGNRFLPMFGASGVAYLLRDEFTTTRAAGAVNGTAAEPGAGTRTVTDTESKLRIGIPYGVLMFGDSKTVGAQWHSQLTNSSIAFFEMPTRIGTSGITTAGRRETVDTDLAACLGTPDVIAINLGANDCPVMPTQAQWELDMGYMVDAMHTK